MKIKFSKSVANCLGIILALASINAESGQKVPNQAEVHSMIHFSSDDGLRGPSLPSSIEQKEGSKELIVGGRRIGPLHLGDSEAAFYKNFTRKPNIDEAYDYPGCGRWLHWVDMERNHTGVIAIVQGGKITQIDSSTTRYATADGISLNSRPEEVKPHYPGVRAYVAINSGSMALGDRDLVYWVDWAKGIAFAFAYSQREPHRRVYYIVVFPSKGKFCVGGEPQTPENWRELSPYSLEPPQNSASKR